MHQVPAQKARSIEVQCKDLPTDWLHTNLIAWLQCWSMFVLCFLGAVGDPIHDSRCSHHPQNRWEEGLVAQLSDSRFLQWKATQCCKSHLNLSLTTAMTWANNMFSGDVSMSFLQQFFLRKQWRRNVAVASLGQEASKQQPATPGPVKAKFVAFNAIFPSMSQSAGTQLTWMNPCVRFQMTNEPCFFLLCCGYTLAWRIRERLRWATVCVNVAYARLRGIHLPTRNASAKNRARTFSFFYGAAEVDEEELEEPVLDDHGWGRRLCVWRFFLVAALRNLEAAWESKCSGSSRRCNMGGAMCFCGMARNGKDLSDGCVGYANASAEATQRLRGDEN